MSDLRFTYKERRLMRASTIKRVRQALREIDDSQSGIAVSGFSCATQKCIDVVYKQLKDLLSVVRFER